MPLQDKNLRLVYRLTAVTPQTCSHAQRFNQGGFVQASIPCSWSQTGRLKSFPMKTAGMIRLICPQKIISKGPSQTIFLRLCKTYLVLETSGRSCLTFSGIFATSSHCVLVRIVIFSTPGKEDSASKKL